MGRTWTTEPSQRREEMRPYRLAIVRATPRFRLLNACKQVALQRARFSIGNLAERAKGDASESSTETA